MSVDAPNDDIKAFVMDYGITYLILRADEATARLYLAAANGIPQTYFIDGAGVVRGHIYGSAPRDAFEAKLKDLQAGPK
jgi:hypothetical protein